MLWIMFEVFKQYLKYRAWGCVKNKHEVPWIAPWFRSIVWTCWARGKRKCVYQCSLLTSRLRTHVYVKITCIVGRCRASSSYFCKACSLLCFVLIINLNTSRLLTLCVGYVLMDDGISALLWVLRKWAQYQTDNRCQCQHPAVVSHETSG